MRFEYRNGGAELLRQIHGRTQQETASIIALVLVAVSFAPANLLADLIVNTARPITHRVSVQIIQTALDDGTLPATVFGSSSQSSDIMSMIDTIWAKRPASISISCQISSATTTRLPIKATAAPADE